MELNAAKPTKKRRRWPVVAFVLFLVSLVSWWHWPRGDARFVGNWDTVRTWDSRFLPESLFLFESGEVVIDGFERPPTLTIAFRWTTSGDSLTLRPATAGIGHVLAGPFDAWLAWARALFEVEDTFDFRFESDANRVLLHRNEQPVVLLERHPE